MHEVLHIINWMAKNKSISFDVTKRLVGGAAYDEEGDEAKGIPNKARYKHSGNLSRDLTNYLKIVKTIFEVRKNI